MKRCSFASLLLPLLSVLSVFILVGCTETDPGAANGDGDGDGDETETGTGIGDGDGDGDGVGAAPFPDADDGVWTYMQIDGSLGRDGSQTGVVIRYANSNKLAIYFQGGGACFNSLTCGGNTIVAGQTVAAGNSSGGVFNNTSADNPLMDYNWVFVPYTTGDVHFGSNPSGDVTDSLTDQKFIGHQNVLRVLPHIVATFKNVESLVITGESAGGLGAISNFESFAQAFPDTQISVIDDSAPLFADAHLAPCLQQLLRDLWGLNDSFPEDCDTCSASADGGGMVNYFMHESTKHPDVNFGLISSLGDSTMAGFFGYGANDCDTTFPSMSAAEYEAGLVDLRDNILTGDNWGTYYIPGTAHTWISNDAIFFGQEISGVVIADWFGALIDGSPSHVAP